MFPSKSPCSRQVVQGHTLWFVDSKLGRRGYHFQLNVPSCYVVLLGMRLASVQCHCTACTEDGRLL